MLRIFDDRHFDVVWTGDGWQTKQTCISRGLGSAGFCADIVPADGCSELEWTLRWTEQDAWLGYNVKVKIEAAT